MSGVCELELVGNMWKLLGNVLELVGTAPELEGIAWKQRGKDDDLPALHFSAKRLNLFKPGVSILLTMLGTGLPELLRLL